MGKISKVEYSVLPDTVYSDNQLSQSYFYGNVLGLSKELDSEYEEYELEQSRVRRKALKDLGSTVNTNSILFGSSLIKRKVVLIAET